MFGCVDKNYLLDKQTDKILDLINVMHFCISGIMTVVCKNPTFEASIIGYAPNSELHMVPLFSKVDSNLDLLVYSNIGQSALTPTSHIRVDCGGLSMNC